MIRYPGAEWRPLGRQTEPEMDAHDIVCAHTMVASLVDADRYFRSGNGTGFDGTEAHYGVGGRWGEDAERGLDGAVWQWQERSHTADANGPDGNWHVISIETADNAPRLASAIAPWTARQVDALVALIAWECSPAAHAGCPTSWTCRRGVDWRGRRVAIPPVLIPDTKPGRRGLAVHRQGVKHSQGFGVPGYLVVGGERWSVSPGKECPGDARVAQFVDVVIPRVQQRLVEIIDGPPTTTGAEMQGSDKIDLGPGSSAILNQPDQQMTFEETIAVRTASQVQQQRDVRDMLGELRKMNTLLAAMLAKLPDPPAGG